MDRFDKNETEIETYFDKFGYLEFIFFFIFFILLLAYFNKKHGIIISDFQNTYFLVNIIIIIGITIWGFRKGGKIKRTVQMAINAFIAAYLSRIDLVFSAFYLVAYLYYC